MAERVRVALVKNKRGTLQPLLEGYSYRKQLNDPRNSRIIFKCSAYSTLKCKARVCTDLNMEYYVGDLPKANAHSCGPPDADKFKAISVVCDMRETAAAGGGRPASILGKRLGEISDAVAAKLPKTDSLKRGLRRSRNKKRPPEPDSLENLVFKDEWTTTGGVNPEEFLKFDSGPGSKERVIIFTTDRMLRHFSEAKILAADGNHKAAPKHFQQLYVIRVPSPVSSEKDIWVNAAYVLLENKTKSSYDLMFSEMNKLLQELNLPLPELELFLVDFELAMIQSVIEFYIIERIQCCFFHLTQNTWKHIVDEGLRELYMSDPEFSLYIRKVDAIGFVPLGEVADAFRELVREAKPEWRCQPFLDYFGETYILGKFKSKMSRAGQITLTRTQKPLFKPKIWNVFDSTIQNKPRTNNRVEGWNCRFNGVIGRRKPGSYEVVEKMQDDQRLERQDILKWETNGEIPIQRGIVKYKQLQERLHNLCIAYRDKVCSRADFLRRIAYNLHLGDEKSSNKENVQNAQNASDDD